MATNDAWSFEEKSQYYSKIALGKDIKTQVRVIAEATKELLVSQANLSSSIVVSHDRIIDGLDYLAPNAEDVKDGIDGMKSAFELSLSEVMWQIEKNKKPLQDLLKAMMFHLDTKTKDRRKRADTYYDNAQIEQAEDEFISFLDINEYDFSIHISLGMISLFQVRDLDDAIYYFDNAAKYARSKSKYYTSFALMYKALALREDGLVADAKQCLEEAIDLSPDFCEPRYQLSLIESQVDRQHALSLLLALVDTDIRYSLKIENEPSFLSMRKEIHEEYNSRITEQLNDIQTRHDDIISDIKRILEHINHYKTVIADEYIHEDTELTESESKLRTTLQRTLDLANRKSLIDAYTAGRVMMGEIPRVVRDFRETTYNYLAQGIEHLRNEKAEMDSLYHAKEEEQLLNAITGGKTAVLTYSIIYIITFIMFRDLFASITLSAIPFVIAWLAKHRQDIKQKQLVSRIDGKLERLIAIRDSL